MGSDCGPDRHPTSSTRRAKNLMTVFAQADAARSCAVLSVIGILISSGQAMTPRFDAADVVRQVRAVHSERSPAGLMSLPDIGEFLIDTNVITVLAPEDQRFPSIGFDGTNFLVVWTDHRSSGQWDVGSEWDIYGARVTPHGVVLDPAGFVISREAQEQYFSAVGFDGENFLVVWEDARSGTEWDIYGARVTPAGTVLDPSGIAISQEEGYQRAPAVGYDGVSFLVVWQDYRGGSNYADIFGARVTPQGTILDPAGIAIAQEANDQDHPAVGFDGTNFLVVWGDFRNDSDWDVYGARVTPQGAVLDPPGIAISQAPNNQYVPTLAFGGGNFLVAWEDKRSGSADDIYGARVTPQGAVLDPGGVPISQAASGQVEPALAFDGANFLVIWEDHRVGGTCDIYGSRVTPQGTVLDSSGVAISSAEDCQWSPKLAFDGANFFAAWEDFRSSEDDDIYGARVTRQGVVLDSMGVVIAEAANDQRSPALAYDGENFLAVWEEHRSGKDHDIYGARVTPQGAMLDPAGFVISEAANDQLSPAVGFDGANFLVAWRDYRSGSDWDIYGARVTPQGAVLDSLGIAISRAADDQSSPALGLGGANLLVVWEDHRGSDCDIYGARVTPAGAVLDSAGIAISTAPDAQWSPALAFDGANFLAVWQDFRNGINRIYGARVTPQGAVLDPTGIAVMPVGSGQYTPVVAFGDANFLVAWQGFIGSGNDYDILAARVTPAGTVPDSTGIVLSQAAYDQRSASIGFDGANFLVVWADHRSSSYLDIYGARVTPAGVVFDSGPVVRQEGNQDVPALGRGVGSSMFLVYQGWTGTVGGKIYNTYRTWGRVDPNPAVAEVTNPEVRKMNSGATVVRGVMFLAERASSSTSCLLDVSGRKVLDLQPGANDVRGLAPGVYFVREAQAQAQAQVVRKVVVTR
jgi:phosphoribosylformylglycinamidine (FGAM) synthase PurS component